MIDFINLIDYTTFIKEVFLDRGVSNFWAELLNLIITLSIIAVGAYFLDRTLRRIIIKGFDMFSVKTTTTFDDFLVQSKFPRYIAHIIPLIFLEALVPSILIDFPLLFKGFEDVISIYAIVLFVKIIRSFLRSTQRYLRTKERYKDKPLESYIQVIMIFLWGLAIIFIIYQLTGRDILSFATLGAASAVILLIFKDTILGFVASIQVSVNDIVRIGDWIAYPKFGADGTVTDINLASVRVRNWDNTFTTIPTYSLISDSFQNWRGMEESGGRRIKRAILIKQSSIKFLTKDEIDGFKKINLVSEYLEDKYKEITDYNNKINADKSVLINGRNLTNFGVFRKYLDAYLNQNASVSKELFSMVRQLAPTSKGIPLEIYCFSTNKQWAYYEAIMADIFDHVIAAIPYFDLEVFEEPTGKDLQTFVKESQK
ncbi:mechanosensitive ion channel family protein [Lutibacter sp. A80]|uniref:mechanosensitive ion channel family protein n=1 Tax=Lutibacter sp. A80 TaxID=2918453 RepID=UPI001F05B27D|nr:mechanosensitive ion channel domain-containing protein [Lutibacter sp. A80]UMB60578.1 mechanosensitive ion channel family protein [Lutibacter sp. A80]